MLVAGASALWRVWSPVSTVHRRCSCSPLGMAGEVRRAKLAFAVTVTPELLSCRRRREEGGRGRGSRTPEWHVGKRV